MTGKLPRADGDLAVGCLSGLLYVNGRVKQHEDSRLLVILEHIIPQDRHACDTDSGSNAQPLERQTGREQHDNRNHQVLDRHAGVARREHDRPHHYQRVQTDRNQSAPFDDMILYFGHVRSNREDEDQLAKLTRLQACHAQIEPCTLAVDLGAERRKQQKLQQNVADHEYFP